MRHWALVHTIPSIHRARCEMINVVENKHSDPSLNSWRNCLHNANNVENGMNPIIFPPAMGKL